ncbi:hypothetical protein N602_24255 [Mycobacterium avium subsp. hominissuis 10-5606]|nr:hypothetical protein N602_24255 [Mycobacterium avium subsp. hominissuis 10-5606]
MPLFAPAALSKHAPGVEDLSSGRIDAMLTHHSGDLHDEFAMPLVVETMATVLGLPTTDFLDYKECADQVLTMIFNAVEAGASFESMRRAFDAIFGEAITSRRQLLEAAGIDEPVAEHIGSVLPDDVMSALMASRRVPTPSTTGA